MLALIKLQNGQEMIGTVVEDSVAKITIEDPLQINYRLVATQPMPTVSVSRYMPFASVNIFTFDRHELLHVVEPKKAMAEYYKNALINYREVIDENVEQELMSASASEDFEDGDGDMEDAYKALLERINLKGPLN